MKDFIETINKWSFDKTPFLFLIDFEMQKPIAFRLADISPDEFMYDFNGITNVDKQHFEKELQLQKFPHPFADYEKKFHQVLKAIQRGDSYLTNLTVRTPIKINCSLADIFRRSNARYKILYRDSFTVFSPETFVKIVDCRIFSFPMKGTIDAAVPDAANVILNDRKELAEHVTIVDLIRNDLSIVADHVTVTDFRYLEEIHTLEKKLLQVSSKIEGVVKPHLLHQLGTLIVSLLPAGSISGAPKKRTVEIIHEAENETRGYYTGICGIFDGKSFDSGVMIRFIEKEGEELFYRSGGGITALSNMQAEYQETIDKIYVPLT